MGERLEIFVAALSLKKGDFASVLEMPQSQLSRYFGSDPRTPPKEVLEKIAMMGCNLNWLVTGEGSMYADNEAGKALKKKRQALGKDHEPELIGNLSDMPEFQQKILNPEEIKVLESLVQKLKGQ